MEWWREESGGNMTGTSQRLEGGWAEVWRGRSLWWGIRIIGLKKMAGKKTIGPESWWQNIDSKPKREQILLKRKLSNLRLNVSLIWTHLKKGSERFSKFVQRFKLQAWISSLVLWHKNLLGLYILIIVDFKRNNQNVSSSYIKYCPSKHRLKIRCQQQIIGC